MNIHRLRNLFVTPFSFLLLIIFGCYTLYAFVLILRSSFLINSTKYFVLFDDMMISMRYAKNFAHGYGLVWNNGERVEGYTNLLWTLYMSVFHLLPIPQNFMSLPIQVTGIVTMIGTLFFVSKIAAHISKNNRYVILASIILTAWYFPLNNWAVILGTEVSILTFIITYAIYLALKAIQEERISYTLIFLLGLSTLIRFDMIVPALVITLYLILTVKEQRKKYLIHGIGVLMLFIVSQTLWRYWYYHDLLPNTYYLKMSGFPLLYRISRGAVVAWDFILSMNWVLFFIPFLVLIKKSNKYLLLLTSVFLMQIAYSIYVGGDAWEYFGGSNRYISIAIPLFFILFAYAFATSITNLHIPNKLPKIGLMWFLFIAASLLTFNSSHLENFLLFEKPLITVGGNKINVERAIQIDTITRPDATIAVIWAGTMAYFSDRTFIDLYGKSDRTIAYSPMHYYPPNKNPFIIFVPGHMKWEYAYSIGNRKPDIITQLHPYEHAEKYIKEMYTMQDFDNFSFYLKKNSENILWNKLQ